MSTKFRRVIAGSLLAAFTLAASPPTATLAQFSSDDSVEPVSPPRPGKPDDSAPVVMTYLLGILLLAGAVGANLIPPKRGHQD